MQRPFPRFCAVAVALAALAAASPASASAATSCTAANYAVTPLQSDVFYIDVQSAYLGSYVGYRVTNQTGAPASNLWVRLENFSGGVVAPASGAATTSASALPTLANAAHAPTYAYLKAGAETLTDQLHDVVVYRGRPGAGGTELCRQSETLTSVQDVIKAAANKVTGATGPSSATLGGTFTLSVAGASGTIGAGIASDPGIVRFSPAVAASWPSSAFRLVGVTHRLPLGAMPVPDVLSRSNMSGGNQDYSIDYTFRVVGPTATATPIIPVQNIASGTQVKHTDPGSFSSLAPIPVVTSTATVAVAAGGTAPYASGASVPLTAELINPGSVAITVDELVLTLPGAWSAVAGSWTLGGAAVPDPFDEGNGKLHLVGPFTIPAGGSSTVAFDALAGTAGSTGAFTSYAVLPGGQIDATADPKDDVPASTPLRVLGAPDAVDDSFSPASGVTEDLDVLANDADGAGTPALSIVSGPAHGTASIVAGKVRYTSTSGYVGADSLDYRITTAGGTDTATVSLTVTAPPAAPDPQDTTSTGVGTARQQVTLSIPSDGTLRLISNGTEVTELTVPGEGTFALDPATGVLTFDPVLGFAGTAAPVTYRATDALGQTGEATHTPTVTEPAAPAPADRTSSGVAPAVQSVTLTIPSGGRIALLDAGGAEATAVIHAGEGTFALDPDTGEVAFTPVAGFSGIAAPVSYRVVDAYGQAASANYTPTVTKPAAPVAPAVTSTGVGTAAQTGPLAVLTGGSVHLVDPATNASIDTVTVPGEGTYVLDPATGEVTFTPVLGFSGQAAGITYRVTDAYGQPTTGTYTPAVTLPAPPPAPTQVSSGDTTTPQTRALPVPDGGSIRLVDRLGNPATTVEVPGVGTFVLEPATGMVTFTPSPSFAGGQVQVTYAITDPYGQVTTGTYAASVEPATPLSTGPLTTILGQAATPPAGAIPPVAERCVSNRVMVMHWLVNHHRLARVMITVNGKRSSSLPGSARKGTVDMRGFGAQEVRVVITGVTRSGRRLTATRTYITCIARRVGTPLPTLRLR